MADSLSPLPCDLLVFAETVVTQDADRRILSDAGVAMRDGMIVDVSDRNSLKAGFTAQEELDLGPAMLMPGLVNGHTHLPMTLFRGVADDLPLMDWLEKHIWPVEMQLTPELLELGAMVGCMEMIRTGTTAFLNGYFKEEAVGDAVERTGIRAVIGEGFFDFPSPHFPSPEHYRETVERLVDRYQNSSRVRVAVTPHAVFTVGADALVESHALAQDMNIPWQIHLAESPAETQASLKKHGKRPVELLESLGLLSEHVTLHHCVDLTDREIRVLADSGARVVHNPCSNLKLASGVAPVQKLLDAGAVMGLGTDGAASNNQLNMFREMSTAALLGKIAANDASAVNAGDVLDMATRGSAACLGWETLGRLEAGCPADMIALDLRQPNMMPMYAPTSHAVYAATGMEVRLTIAEGRILYRDGEFLTLDAEKLRREIRRAAKWISAKKRKK
ncbi:amidohydrolase family protein [Pseudodesulfovibrio tunisiensis]|uniref:amidohydrolase family protein n=1 Tax=Pseudodesulfovibrio tunisiensis TaxID=463192 RepID=UPI001FB3EB41|nr:amidohydrolase [Pseudodesulfovibrio tunisiensis]